MRIQVADAGPEQFFAADEVQNLVVTGDKRLGQLAQITQYGVALAEISQGQLTNDEWMRQHLPVVEQSRQKRVATSQVVDPNRRVDENHAGAVCRRGTGEIPGSLPPSRASRRAVSRSTNAFSAIRTKADFSSTPVKACALATRSSSSEIVVRMPEAPVFFGTKCSII